LPTTALPSPVAWAPLRPVRHRLCCTRATRAANFPRPRVARPGSWWSLGARRDATT